MGFTTQMRDAAREASGLDVLLPRTLVASVVSELLG
jgi:protein AroM